jgi:hypothetical protein
VLRLRLLRPVVREYPAGGRGGEGKRIIFRRGDRELLRQQTLSRNPYPSSVKMVAQASRLCGADVKAGSARPT